MSYFFFSSRRRHTRFSRDWSSDVCSSDLGAAVGVGDQHSVAEDGDARARRGGVGASRRRPFSASQRRTEHLERGRQRWIGAGSADRKSTRLNTSHVKISYAVFCLKKKKQN